MAIKEMYEEFFTEFSELLEKHDVEIVASTDCSTFTYLDIFIEGIQYDVGGAKITHKNMKKMSFK